MAHFNKENSLVLTTNVDQDKYYLIYPVYGEGGKVVISEKEPSIVAGSQRAYKVTQDELNEAGIGNMPDHSIRLNEEQTLKLRRVAKQEHWI